MTGNDVDKQLADLNDPNKVTWTAAERLDWTNAGVREIATHKPKATTVSLNITLDTGTRQSVPEGTIAVLDLIVNMGAEGVTPGRGITTVSAERLRASRPSWRSDSGDEVRHLVMDDRDPGHYYVWPGPANPTVVEALLHQHPAAIADLSEALPLDDSYLNALASYVKFRAYAKDGENADHAALSIAWFNSFANALGIQVMKQKKASAPANAPDAPMHPAVDKNGV